MSERGTNWLLPKMIKSEGDVRQWLRARFGMGLLWIEPSAGSTFGIPDSLLLIGDGRTIFIEAKLAVGKGPFRFKVRAGQRLLFKRLMMLRQPVLFAIGIKGTSEVVLVPATFETCSGVLMFFAVEEYRKKGIDKTLLDCLKLRPPRKSRKLTPGDD